MRERERERRIVSECVRGRTQQKKEKKKKNDLPPGEFRASGYSY